MHSQRFEGQEFQIKGRASSKTLTMLEKLGKNNYWWRPTLGNGKEAGSTGMVF